MAPLKIDDYYSIYKLMIKGNGSLQYANVFIFGRIILLTWVSGKTKKFLLQAEPGL
jgi:hypothetical protein